MGCEWLQYWTIIASPVSSLLLQLNSSFNFIIYCFFNKSFREKLLSLIATSTQLLGFRCCQNVDESNLTNQSTIPTTKMTSLPNGDCEVKHKLERIESVDHTGSFEEVSKLDVSSTNV